MIWSFLNPSVSGPVSHCNNRTRMSVSSLVREGAVYEWHNIRTGILMAMTVICFKLFEVPGDKSSPWQEVKQNRSPCARQLACCIFWQEHKSHSLVQNHRFICQCTVMQHLLSSQGDCYVHGAHSLIQLPCNHWCTNSPSKQTVNFTPRETANSKSAPSWWVLWLTEHWHKELWRRQGRVEESHLTMSAASLPGLITAVCSFAGSTVARSPTCATAVVSGLLRRAPSPTTCVATQGRSPTCVTPAEKPLLSQVLSSPIPENTQVRGDRGNLCPGISGSDLWCFHPASLSRFFPLTSF